MELGTRIHAYTDDALGRLDACGIAARIANGEVSAREVVQAAVDRARVADPQLNALAATDFDAALAAAGDADRGAATTRAPLHGVPTLIKDNTAVAGLPTQGMLMAMIRDYDVLLSPTVAHATPELGHLTPDQDFATWLDRFVAYDGIAPLNNISGTPAVTLPLHRTSSGLPCGVQFAGGIGEERTLLELAFELEEAAPWPLIDADSWP